MIESFGALADAYRRAIVEACGDDALDAANKAIALARLKITTEEHRHISRTLDRVTIPQGAHVLAWDWPNGERTAWYPGIGADLIHRAEWFLPNPNELIRVLIKLGKGSPDDVGHVRKRRRGGWRAYYRPALFGRSRFASQAEATTWLEHMARRHHELVERGDVADIGAELERAAG